jgi:hypothetical protein
MAGEITAENSFVIPDPWLLMLNLMGEAADDMLARDRAALTPIFKGNVRVETTQVPRCHVLFLYCRLDERGRVEPHGFHFRDVIKSAGAHIAVVASEIPQQHFSDAFDDYRNDWPANVVLTIARKGDNFGRFFHDLFARMQQGTGMLMAWVELAPQGPVQSADLPAAVFLPEAGHLALGLPSRP